MTYLKRFRLAAKRIVFLVVALLLISSLPAPALFADAVSTGPGRPVGADAGMFQYDKVTGLWESKYYIWNPATDQRTPKNPPVYTYNTAMNQWQTTQWNYSAAAGTYVPAIISVAQLPPGAVTAGANSMNSSTAPAGSTPSNTQARTSNSPAATPTLSTTTGPASNNGTTNDSSQNTNLANNTTATMTNQLGVTSQSGDIAVNSNTKAGDATSGAAMALVNVLNLLQSSSSLDGSGANTFVANIGGDIQGNLVIDPALLAQTGLPAVNTTNNLQVKNQLNGQINNTINIKATSGNANITHNTTAGNATSGNAAALVNVMNMINSIIAAHQSFIGVVNIQGNLNGNILVPAAYLNSLLANNAATPSSTDVSGNTTTTTNVTQDNNTTIANTINASAASGTASVAGNTGAGNATSGTGATKVTLLNLTGSQIVGSDCLLVFVNVLGSWVGLIMDAPAGTTAAAFGGAGTIQQSTNSNTNITATNRLEIANTITADASSGDAGVHGNTNAGNATSGNAKVAVNVLNVANSQLSLSGWFGVLFINVLGNWVGNFGAVESNAPAPVPTKPTYSSRQVPPTGSGSSSQSGKITPQVFRFLPGAAQAAATIPLGMNGNSFALTKHVSQILGASTLGVPTPNKASSRNEATTRHQDRGYDVWIGVGLVGAGAVLFATEQVVNHRKRR